MKHNEKLTISGTVIVRSHPAGTIDRYKELVKEGRNDKAEALIKQGKVEVRQHNLVVDSPGYGLDLIIQRLVGTNTYSLNITHGEIGTGSTTPQSSDTALQAGVARVSTTYSADNANTTAVLQFFFTDATLPDETYYEFGTFVDGNYSLGTGRLFNHALFTEPYVKVPGQDTTVEVDFDLS